MNAKEYAEQYNTRISTGEKDKVILLNIFEQFVKEIRTIANNEKRFGISAVVEIINEQDEKWREFAKLVAGVNPNGFVDLIRSTTPEAYDILIENGFINQKNLKGVPNNKMSRR